MKNFVIFALGMIFHASPSAAEMTDWMTEKKLRQYVERHMNGGKAYPTQIQCWVLKGKTYLRLKTVPYSGQPPFHRWQWLHARTDTLPSAIANLRLRSKPELKYKVVSRHEYEHLSQRFTCVVVYR